MLKLSWRQTGLNSRTTSGFFGRLKNEFFYPRDLRAFTLAQFIDAVDAYIRWYNESRIKMSLGGLSPIEYRQSLGLMT